MTPRGRSRRVNRRLIERRRRARVLPDATLIAFTGRTRELAEDLAGRLTPDEATDVGLDEPRGSILRLIRFVFRSEIRRRDTIPPQKDRLAAERRPSIAPQKDRISRRPPESAEDSTPETAEEPPESAEERSCGPDPALTPEIAEEPPESVPGPEIAEEPSGSAWRW